MKNIIQRVQEPTPRFFRKIRNAGLLLTAVSGALMSCTSPAMFCPMVASRSTSW